MDWKNKYPKEIKPGKNELLDFFPPHIRELFITFDREMNERFKVENRYGGADQRFLKSKGWVFGYGRDYGVKLLEMSIENDYFCVLGINITNEATLRQSLLEAQKKYDDGYEARYAAKSTKSRTKQSTHAKGKVKESVTNDTVIAFGKPSSAELRKFFKNALGEHYEKYASELDYTKLWNKHIGKTLQEVMQECMNPTGTQSIEKILSERRFDHISEPDKNFIIAFDDAMIKQGYDFGDGVGSAIKYGKTGTKTRACPAHIEIKEDGIVLRLFLSKVDVHREYIENAPSHIKDGFVFDGGDCRRKSGECMPNYCSPKRYTLNGRNFEKCVHYTFRFSRPSVEKLPDYSDLLSEFQSKKKSIKDKT